MSGEAQQTTDMLPSRVPDPAGRGSSPGAGAPVHLRTPLPSFSSVKRNSSMETICLVYGLWFLEAWLEQKSVFGMSAPPLLDPAQ